MDNKKIEELKAVMAKSIEHHKQILSWPAGFDAWCKECEAIEGPLAQWFAEQVEILFQKHEIMGLSDLKARVLKNDRECHIIPVKVSGIIHEDEEYKLFSILDYDCDTTLAKTSLIHKPSGISHRIDYDIASV